ncbi:expressed protein [Batrachochytrium dendrobatidis JAM81]|uniref:Expressed protein n=1 Tax=Batrachochytrium dendrobatidis (strain JAM81 / FGSC 10211) TaxID=684364 RepID=F4P9N7_BATDJ|nr:uncharacterized protein BATDEDRAFT_35826 [Batrachochytrium dendrobatidis JAM81]EGF77811.1 expressed protein [Batrachochytrium dendrobatidis JAM81]KAK5670294.1 hypothetical protein QVD99_002993 [Batrachochytrium dendrobatidis]|eukprot:XP_006681449.1 expressed protein [Batrachochytrium dendrobatidis JAM81]
MKFSITILSLILAVCSVTIANSVIPSATTSAESSPSTVADLDVDSVDCGKYSRKAKKLIKAYATNKRCIDTTKEMCKSIARSISVQTELIQRLSKRLELLESRCPLRTRLSYDETVLKLGKERKTLAYLEKQEKVCRNELLDLRSKLRVSKRRLIRHTIWDHSNFQPASLYTMYLEEEPIFMDCFNQFFTDIPSPLSKSMHASTSRTQSSSQQGPSDQSPSEKTSIAHSTQASSRVSHSLQRASSSLQKASCNLINKFRSLLDRSQSEDCEPLI